MVKFIELTEDDNQPLFVNVDNVIWVRPYKEAEGSLIYVAALGKNDYPVSLFVKESYSQVTKLIQK